MKEESERAGLKLSVKNTKIMAPKLSHVLKDFCPYFLQHWIRLDYAGSLLQDGVIALES